MDWFTAQKSLTGFSKKAEKHFCKAVTDMVIFSCPHMGALSEVLALRYIKCENEQAVLLTPQNFGDSKFSKNIARKRIFDRIISTSFDIRPFTESESLMEEKISAYYDGFFQKCGINLKDVTAFYLWADVENLLSVYLSLKGIKHTLVEMYEGQFKQDWRYGIKVTYLNYKPAFETMQRKWFALCGEGGSLINRITVGSGGETARDGRIDLEKQFLNMESRHKKKLLRCFKPSVLSRRPCSLFLLNSDGYSDPKTKLSGQKRYLAFQIIADYIRERPLILKNHPADTFDFHAAFSKAKTAETNVPIEFFALDPKMCVKNIYSVNSTGGDKISAFINENIKLGDAFLFDFRILHKLYAAFALSEYMSDEFTRHHFFGIDLKMAENAGIYMFGAQWKEGEPFGINPEILLGNIFAVIGAHAEAHAKALRGALAGASADTKVLLFDDSCLPHTAEQDEYGLLQNIVTFRIVKKPCRKTILADTEEEIFYFYCKEDAAREKVKNFFAEKILENTGLEIKVEAVQP